MKLNTKNAFALTKDTFNRWSAHNATRLGAAVAFYTLLSMAPLLVMVAGIMALVFDQQSARNALAAQASQMIGSRGAEEVQSLLKSAQNPGSGMFATVVAFATLLFGASGVFGELRDALNTIWDVQEPDAGSVWGLVRSKLFSFGMVLSIGFLLLVSLLVSTALSYVGKFFAGVVPVPTPVLQVANFLFSFVVITVLFGLIFRFVPAKRVAWRDLRVGAVVTALLFTIGKLALGLYLGKASVGSAYTAAGSLVAVIVWVYYAAQIFFFGAEFTRVYADADAGRVGESAASKSGEQKDSATGQGAGPAVPANAATGAKEQVPAAPVRPVLVKTAQAPVETVAASIPVETVTRRPSAMGAVAGRKPTGRSVLLAMGTGFLFGWVSNKVSRSPVRRGRKQYGE